jgi:hypothetical protein
MADAVGQVSSGTGEPPAPYSIGGSHYRVDTAAIKVVGAGVDTLYQNYSLSSDVLASWRSQLEDWKLAAQEANERYRLPLGDGLLFISPKGRGRHYSYVIERPDVGELLISYSKLFEGHPVRVKLYSSFLVGCSSQEEQDLGALALVQSVFGQGCALAVQVSEVHIAVDFVGFAPTVPDLQQERFVCRAEFGFENVDFGDGVGVINSCRWSKHGAPVSAVLYNKGKEIQEQSEHKRYLLDRWRAAGWTDDLGDVFRLEFRFTRDWLRERGIDSFVALDLAKLLATGMEWLELRDPEGANKTRWPVSSVWTSIQGQAAAILQGVWEPFKRDYVPNVTVTQLAAQVGGCVACVGALVGHDDLDDLFSVVRGLFEQKLEATGQNLADMVQKRRDRYMLPAGVVR